MGLRSLDQIAANDCGGFCNAETHLASDHSRDRQHFLRHPMPSAENALLTHLRLFLVRGIGIQGDDAGTTDLDMALARLRVFSKLLERRA